MEKNVPPPVRLGIFGGTFDPVHNGHLAAARCAASSLSLTQVVFLPAAASPFKSLRPVTALQHRLAMLQAALIDMPAFSLSRLEADRPPPSFTIDSIEQFRAGVDPDIKIYFLIGSDAFLEINSWKSWKKLFRILSFAVFPRQGGDLKKISDFLDVILPNYHPNASQCRWFDASSKNEDGQEVILIPMPPVAISSTEIRSHLRHGQACSGMLPEAVEEYIRKNRLYLQ